ncbi:MAG: hypothetical protein ACI4GY_07890, partial [Acutalibacteraceae bacterium]
MKLGKKVLSCVLAVMMIVTSISATFTVFGAGVSQLRNLYTQINMDYDGLMDAINSGKDERVPTQTSGVNYAVAVDTYHSGWYNVAKAFSAYAKAVTVSNSVNTYKDIVDLAVQDMVSNGIITSSDGSTGATQADVQKVLNYFTFGTDVTGGFTGASMSRTLNIGTGYDILAYDKIEDIETDRTYYTAQLTFTIASKNGTYGITPDTVSFTSTTTLDPDADVTVAAIKAALLDCVADDAFKAWFNLDLDSMTVDEIMELVVGEKSCANVLSAYQTVAELSSSAEPDELWDHYVAERVGKTYAETEEWINNGLLDAINNAYASSYKKQFDEKMATDYSAYTADEILDFYNSVVAIDQALHNQTNYKGINIFEEILPHFDGGADYYNVTVTDYMAVLKADVARAYAKVYADELTALLAEEVPTYDHESEDATAAWPGSADEAAAKDFLNRATVLKENIDTFVLGYGTFEDVKAAFSDNKNRITEALYNQLLAKMDTVKIDVNGYQHFETKAKMENLIKTTVLPGQSFAQLTAYSEEFRGLYNKAVALSKDTNNTAVYAAVYPDGIDEYTRYFNTVKAAVAQRIVDQVARVETYYKEGGNAVVYYNFEAIIDSYNAIETDLMTLSAYLTNAPAYVPEEGMPSVDNLSTRFSTISGYYNSAISFKEYIGKLKSDARADNTDAKTQDKTILSYILKKTSAASGNNYYNYGWLTAVNKLNVDNVTEFVNEIGLTYGTVSTTQVRNLMDNAVADFDKMLISEDFGTIMNKLLASTDENGNEIPGLGVWKYDYTDANGVKHTKGSEIKTLPEFLINTIMGVLYSGLIQDLLFKTLMPLIGNAVDGMSDKYVGYVVGEIAPDAARKAIPLMPHQFYKTYSDLPWYKFFNGDITINGSKLYYPKVTETMQTADVTDTWYFILGTCYLSYWDSDTAAKVGTGRENMKPVDWSNWDSNEVWHITNENEFYNALAAAACGLSKPLGTLLTGDSSELTGSIGNINIT